MSFVYGLQSLYQLFQALEKGGQRTNFVGITPQFAQLTATAVSQNASWPTVITLPTEKDLQTWMRILDDLNQDLNPNLNICLLSSSIRWGHDRFVNLYKAKHQRLHTLSSLCFSKERTVILCTLDGLLQYTVPKQSFTKNHLLLETDSELPLDMLTAWLNEKYYQLTDEVTEQGSYCKRGGIIDIFPSTHAQPVRIEFFGDRITSIRSFHVNSQRSLGEVATVNLSPASECFFDETSLKQNIQMLHEHFQQMNADPTESQYLLKCLAERKHFHQIDKFAELFWKKKETVFDYLPSSTRILFPFSEESCLNKYSEFLDYFSEEYKSELAENTPTVDVGLRFKRYSPHLTQSLQVYDFNHLSEDANLTRYAPKSFGKVSSLQIKLDHRNLAQWKKSVQQQIAENDLKILILCSGTKSIEKIQNLFDSDDIEFKTKKNIINHLLKDKLRTGSIYLAKGNLANNVWLEESNTIVFVDHALFGHQNLKPRKNSKQLQSYLSSFRDLQIGDIVVHISHGICRYRGLVDLDIGGQQSDFIQLEFAGQDKIYLPIDKLNLVQKHSSANETSSVKLDKLGSESWQNRKEKLKQSLKKIAEDLVRAHAKRSLQRTNIYPSPGTNYYQFEASFPFNETDDQIKTLNEIHDDLQSSKAMDRLVCGDVGFGKTEIAMRAAFRAMSNGYQVLMLVPTTILCFQHHRNFNQRMQGFDFNIEQVNRFVSKEKTRQTLADLKSGKVNMLIGTHRLLSDDVKPKDIGLLIIDEEQRFGVSHKEILKDYRIKADVLTLSATPIPRTLHMSMLGLKDISIIQTPPQDRLPVKTYVSKFNDTIIQKAIEKEVLRGGQVFFLHNRVQDIHEVRDYIQKLVPNHDCRVAHGQLPEHALEKVVISFMNREFPIIVCTTIIESGIDMPNVNTIIVNNSHQYGLSQLYQLRGRVGRSTHQAYAYFMLPKDRTVNEESKRRLDILSSYQDLGAGFHIATHDLDMRGSGNLIGSQQSGHIHEIGIDLYTQLLTKEIAKLKQEEDSSLEKDVEIKIPISARISDTYIYSERRRLSIYKEIFSQVDASDLADVEAKVIDLYGKPPTSFRLLVQIAKLKMRLNKLKAVHMKYMKKGIVKIKFHSLSEQELDSTLKFVDKNKRYFGLSSDFQLIINTHLNLSLSYDSQLMFTEHLNELITKFYKK